MAHFHDDIHSQRVGQFRQRIAGQILAEHIPLNAQYAHSVQPVAPADRLKLDYQPVCEGKIWGESWESAWFHLTGVVPSEWAGSYVVAQINLSGECLVLDAEGEPMLGLTGGSVFDPGYYKDLVHLYPACRGGEHVDLWVEAAANHLFGLTREGPVGLRSPDRLHGYHEGRVVALRLCRFDVDLWHLWLDLDVLLDLMKALPVDHVRRARLLRGMSEALDAFSGGGTPAARRVLEPLFAVPADPGSIHIHGVGHAHIDTGWLWPVSETRRKCARTFASQVGLIERYPGYVFGASQAQHYAMVKQDYPKLYERIREQVRQGNWEIQGAMWVEADCNLAGGESLIRQVLHGKNFFSDEFGVNVRNLWLPDVFGYSANLPQILKRAGVDYFLTQKLSWSRYNEFPHNTFIWRGLDGSEVLAHFPPENTYNAPVLGSSLRLSETNNKEKAFVDDAVSLFGIGNGGGGPMEEHIERGLRLRDLNGVPRFSFGAAQPILEKLGAHAEQLDTWVGELYLEIHRGTLTTQAQTKRLNRRVEEALRATEMLCAAAGLDAYPAEALDATWKQLLINQFHDILPGSSIHRVYERTEMELKTCLETCARLCTEAAAKIGTVAGDALTGFNPSSTVFDDVVVLPAGWQGAMLPDGSVAPIQQEPDGVTARITIPAQGFLTLRRADALPQTPDATGAAGLTLENDLVSYTFDNDLRLVAGRDKETGRDLVPDGELGNALALYEDVPHAWDAWDIDEYYQDVRVDRACAVEPVQPVGGALRRGLTASLKIGKSTLRQTAWLRPGSKRLDFETSVDWREDHRMLRVGFPTAIFSDQAAYEIQYGYIHRPTHRNTSWDCARFESVGHRWADLSEPDYGVALLNDAKYGYKIHDNVLDLNLLRSPTEPDPVADRGCHRFTYSLLPHIGDLPRSNVLAEAAMLNQGVTLLPGVAIDATMPVALTGDGIELAVIKKAEKEDCLVVRVVETKGRRARGEWICRDPEASIVPTDLMEWNDTQAIGAGSASFSLAPFEIRTFKVRSAIGCA